MKKKVYLWSLLLIACFSKTEAQTMLVFEKDGTQHKFNVDYVQEMYFEEVAASSDYVFTTLSPRVYSNGNVLLAFSTSDGTVRMELDTYGSRDATYLEPGTYTVGAASGLNIDIGDWSVITVDGENKSLKSGTMEVAKDGTHYAMTFDFVLSDDSALKGSYEGGVTGYDGVLSLAASAASYLENDFPEGEIYVRLNDDAWSFAMAIDFFTDVPDLTGRVLPAGTYVYADTKEAGTFGPSSYLETYYPLASKNYKFADGSTVTVTKDGDSYTLEMDLRTTDGMTIAVTYTGTIAPSN